MHQAATIDHVTSVRVEADGRENERRIEEEDRRQDRMWRLHEEAAASGKANAAVEMRWNDLMEHNMPQDLHRVRTVDGEGPFGDALLRQSLHSLLLTGN